MHLANQLEGPYICVMSAVNWSELFGSRSWFHSRNESSRGGQTADVSTTVPTQSFIHKEATGVVMD